MPSFLTATVLSQSLKVYNIGTLTCAALICRLIWILLERLCLSLLVKIPGPKLAAIHNIFSFRLSDVPFEALQDLHKRYGPVVRIGPNEVSVASAIEISKIYGVDAALKKAPIYEMFRSQNVKGPMFAMRDESVHKPRRRLLNPAYSRMSVMVIQPWIFKQCELLCDKMASATQAGEAIDLIKYFRMLAGDTALKMAFNIEGNMVREASIHPIMKDIKIEMRTPFFIRFFARRLIPYIPEWVKDRLPPTFSAQLFALRRIENLAQSYLRQYLNEQKEDTSQHTEVLSRIINAQDPITGEKLSMDELTAEARSLVLAGADTTAITLSYGAWLLLRVPSILTKLRAEISTVMPNSTSLPTDLSTLEALPYLTSCIYETMRLFPAIPGPFPRVVPKEGLEVGGYALPGGSIVGINAFVLQRSQPEIWGENPEEFRPERWLDTYNDVSLMRKAFLAFSTGPRSCIGRNVAMMQLYAMIPVFVMRFNGKLISPMDNMRPAGTFNLAPKGGECIMQLSFAC